MRKKVLIVIGVIFIAFMTWRIVSHVKGPVTGAPGGGRPPVAVEIESVRQAPIKEIHQFTGTVFPIYQYIISPKVSGRVVEIRKRIGDWVTKGEVVARIDDAEYQQAVREAEANLRIAQASLTEAKSQFELSRQELERAQSLQEKGIASPSELDAASTSFDAQKSRLELAQAQVEQREASLTSAKIRLSYTVLAATEPGYIGERYTDEGALLAPNAPLVSVIGINTVLIRTTIIERDYGLIHEGQLSSVMVDAFPGKRFTGKVARIAPLLQEASRVAKMEIEVLNDSLYLKPGMFTRVDIVLNEKESAQIVPSRAVVRRNGKEGVFMVSPDGTQAQYYPVEVGIVTPEATEIVSPKLDGFVVTLGQHLLENGSPIILPDQSGTEGSPAQTGKKGQPPKSGKESGT
ncbi:efflux RND transporter periplasmic adaptor subunit [bacterium]|nr:efflux RND transporter periplasmic adaptor subunit [bacterium]